jgi:phospholipase/lecithinase/hemolysin
MATLQSLLNGLDAATNVPSNVLGVSPMQFISQDTLPAPPSGGYSAVYAFGDSLSDAGNIAFGSLNQIPVSSIYSDGRFSNGNVWVQDLSQDLGLPPVKPSLTGGTDYAYGGAQTGATAVHAANPSDLASQLGQFVANVPNPSPNALYTVWAGSNDVLTIANSTLTPAQQQAAVQQAVTNETNFINGLIAHGAKNLVVLDVPDLSKTPYEAARPASDATSSTLAQQYNAELGQAIQQIVASGAASINYVDTYSVLDSVVANPAAYGFNNVTQPIWNGNLTDAHSGTLAATGAAQNGYLYFDNLHPTAATHSLLAQGIAQSITGTA